MIGSGILANLLALAIFMVTIAEWFYLWILFAFKRPKAPNEHAGRALSALLLTLIAVLAVALTLFFFSLYDHREIDLSLLSLAPLIPTLGIIYSNRAFAQILKVSWPGV